MKLVRLLAILLVLGTINLALMIPGGTVETRSFPEYGVAVLTAFNTFLTLLGLGSLILAYWTFQTKRASVLSILAGVAFVAVYILDLANIFPVATEPMSKTLAAMEWIGTLISLAIIAVGLSAVFAQDSSAGPVRKLPMWLVVVLAGVTFAIVVFATVSAM